MAAATRQGAGHEEAGDAVEQPDYSVLSDRGRETLAAVQEVLGDLTPEPGVLGHLPQVKVAAAAIERACRRAKEDGRLALTMLHCLSCVDYESYFQLVYFLHSIETAGMLVIKADVPYADPRLPSVAGIWPAAEWYEREARDLFGVSFEGNPDGAPLLLYEGFEGFPGRKEFPFYEYREF